MSGELKRAILYLLLALVSLISHAQDVKEKVEIGCDIKGRGVYSVSVCDADVVLPDSAQPHALAELLLRSAIRSP